MAILSAINMVHKQLNNVKNASSPVAETADSSASFKDKLKGVINNVLDTDQANDLASRPNNKASDTLSLAGLASDKGMDIGFDFSPANILDSGLSPQKMLQSSMKDSMQKQFSALGGEISMALMAGIAGQDSATYVAPTDEERLIAEAELTAAKADEKSTTPSLFGAPSKGGDTQTVASNSSDPSMNALKGVTDALQSVNDTHSKIKDVMNLDPRNKMQQILDNSSLLKDKDKLEKAR
ncbi:hypothetical protein PCNPT3_04495 [Psychromonas sp. CNPT3]|uniref:hypothetical protein n=1 Tax=Psychromonas sp. CNPT3 TaxID=314282 RepID=UPI00006E5673|nr:hypothetical protein [Psychromonas sp. CNPT3]AGH80841.1 hypothetical protein PCNPT3_04495 [Psychromonas sp. CNPT3]